MATTNSTGSEGRPFSNAHADLLDGRRGSWELAADEERVADAVRGDGLGFDWVIGDDGVMDMEVSGEPLGHITALVEAANHLIDRHRPHVVRLFCWTVPASAAQASVMSAALGLLGPTVPVAMMIDDLMHLAMFRRQASRSAPWLAFRTDSEVAAAAAAWSSRG